MGLNTFLGDIMYEYLFNNNDNYEDEWEDSLFSVEKIEFEEFKRIVKEAYKECEKKHPMYVGDVHYTEVMNKILEMDKRFFTPKVMATAYIGSNHDIHSDDYDCNSKIRYIHNHEDKY